MRSSTSNPDMSGSRRSSTTQSKAARAAIVQRLGAGAGGDDLDVVVAQQFADAQLLGRIVFDHQQPLAARAAAYSLIRDSAVVRCLRAWSAW